MQPNPWKKYWEPTPRRMRVLGDTILSIGSTTTGYAIIDGNKTWAITMLVLTVLGKFLTNFFTLDNDEKTDQHTS